MAAAPARHPQAEARDLWATANFLADANRCDHLSRQRAEQCYTFTPARARELVATGLWHVEGDGWDVRNYAHLPAPRRPEWEQVKVTTRYQLRAFIDTLRAPETRQLAEEVLVRVLEERRAQLTQLLEEARQRTRAFTEAPSRGERT